jgi:hypothetical protein
MSNSFHFNIFYLNFDLNIHFVKIFYQRKTKPKQLSDVTPKLNIKLKEEIIKFTIKFSQNFDDILKLMKNIIEGTHENN